MPLKPFAQLNLTEEELARRDEMEMTAEERHEEEKQELKIIRKESQAIREAQKLQKLANQIKKGDNAELLNFNMVLAQLPAVDLNSREQVAERTSYYFAYCAQMGNRPNLAGYGLALGLSRQDVRQIVHGQMKVPAETQSIILAANAIIDSTLEDLMMSGGINPVAGIFLMRNNHDYTNEETAVVDKTDPLGEVRDTETIKNKYKDIIDDYAAEGAE